MKLSLDICLKIYIILGIMGTDTNIYVNNNLFERNIDYTIDKMCKRLHLEPFIFGEFNNWKTQEDKKYFNICIDFYETLTEKFYSDHYIEIYTSNLEFNMMEKTVFFFDFNWKFGRWWEFADHLKINAETELIEHYQKQIMDIKFCSTLFNSNQLVLFNDQDHQDIDDKLNEGNMTIDEILLDKRWRIISKPGVTDEDDNDDKRLWSTNYLYYEKWDNLKEFDPELWKSVYLKKVA